MQALTTLSALELVGRLSRVPYWTCLGVPSDHPAVAAETQDWYDAMAGRPAELIAYMQRQLQRRQVYDGPIDGSVGPALKDAVARQRAALGLTPEPKLSLDFFRALLAADVGAPAPRVASAPAAPAQAPGTLGLRIDPGRPAARYVGGEPVHLVVTPSRDAHVYCYHRDENREVVRFFPNRFQRDSRVAAAGGLALPGAMRFQIVMNRRRAPEQIACFATERDVLARLPASLAGGDFAPLPADAMNRLQAAFAEAASGDGVAQQSIELEPR
jgi:hypothetical protein